MSAFCLPHSCEKRSLTIFRREQAATSSAERHYVQQVCISALVVEIYAEARTDEDGHPYSEDTGISI
jgi:hypothetical protein